MRINGEAAEISADEIAEIYKHEPLFAKIRHRICQSSAPVDWDELKRKHDTLLESYRNGTDLLPQDEF